MTPDTSLILIVDVEATCWAAEERSQSADTMEIIEIGAVVANKSGAILSEFSCLVRPVENPILTPFCSELTGIQQTMVEKEQPLAVCMPKFNDWVRISGAQVWASWGRYDLTQFQAEVGRKHIHSELLSLPHLNLKRAWRRSTRGKGQSLKAALEHHQLDFVGAHHRGLDDARNIARLLPYSDEEKLMLELVS